MTTTAGAAVAGVTVTFAVSSGGGAITGATPVTGADGVAAVGSWTLGTAEGPNILTATISGGGITGNPAAFNATAQFPVFSPTANATITGTKNYSTLNIPNGVTVTMTGAVLIRVSGSATIAGTLSGDCVGVELRVTGALTIDGLVRNTCSASSADPPGIKLLADGDLIIGTTVTAQDAIVSDGSIRLTDTGTENLSIIPLAPFSGSIAAPTWSANLQVFPSRANAARVGRPVRAGRGKEVTDTRDGPIEIAGQLEAGNGLDAPAKTQGGTCDNSLALGGIGGRIQLVARNSTLTFKAGASVKAGNGGKGGSCESPNGCPSTAVGGKGGNGGSILLGASSIVFEANVKMIRGNGGAGGDAFAPNADDGPASCTDGCAATATAGNGGDAGAIGFAVLEPGTVTGTPTEEGADGGVGGLANAVGGEGKDCNVCPGGKGGNGGDATASGGQGGSGATGNIWQVAGGTHLKGNGGGALALAGLGGKGASCCVPLPPTQGGNGGNGGMATANAGQVGAAGIGGNGTRGVTAGGGGDGGKGGDGIGPGTGGPLGTGIGDPDDIPDGIVGPPGTACSVDFVLTIISLYYLHQALGGGLSQACVKVRAAETSGLAALIQRGGSSSVLAGAPYTVDWSGPNAVGTTHRTGVLDANGEFFDRQPISAFGTYNVLAAVTSSGLTRSVSGMLNVTGAPGTCPAP